MEAAATTPSVSPPRGTESVRLAGASGRQGA